MQERYFEKMWKCEYCRTEDLSALRNFRCPNCGSPKPEQSHEYYSTKEIFDEEGLKLAMGTQNWVCKYCGTANIGERDHCSNCSGAKTDGTAFVERELDFNPLDEANKFRGTKYDKTPPPQPQPMPYQNTAPSMPPKKRTPILLFAILGVLLVVGGFFLIAKLNTAHFDGKVSQFSWETQTTLERLTLHEEKGKSLPSGAFNVVEKKEFSHTEDVYEEKIVTTYETKYIDKGNGSVVEKQVPVEKMEKVKVGEKDIYEKVYYYDILRWKEVDTKSMDGTGKEIQYPNMNANTSIAQNKEGAERIEEKAQYYIHVEYNKKGKTVEHKFHVSESDFTKAQLGDKLKIKEVFGSPSIVK